MGNLATGGGSSVVAASAHAACTRYRHTDPMLTGVSRRELAKQVGHPDTTAGIPEARWMRAMMFERLVKHEDFVSPLLTTAIGKLELARPAGVRRADGKVTVAATATALQQAHLKAVHQAEATMLTSLAVPFVGMEADTAATPAKPDFAIITPRYDVTDEAAVDTTQTRPVGSWLVVGDAKDYERVRTVINDQRMLKGFLQVALGVEAVLAWSALPKGMRVHSHGVLAVPRNAFLQPTSVVERLDDHRAEVMARVAERAALLDEQDEVPSEQDLASFVAHLEKEFDPATCPSCSLFSRRRTEVRAQDEPHARLVELGVPREQRAALVPVMRGDGDSAECTSRMLSTVLATRDGRAQWTTRRRTDPVGAPSTITVVLAKSDSAALGIYGMGVQRRDLNGDADPWRTEVFEDAQAGVTRLGVLQVLGEALQRCLEEVTAACADDADAAVRVVVPDSVTGDVLASIADSAAGVEIQRLRWARDVTQGRKPLTFDGEPATVPAPLTDEQRLAVSYLLDEDRGRAFSLRQPVVDLRRVLAQHVQQGGPLSDAGRLDLLVEWGEGLRGRGYREVADQIEASEHTPGARLSNQMSDLIHQARRRGAQDQSDYDRLVRSELGYKVEVAGRAADLLTRRPKSKLYGVFAELEGSAQAAWRRREALHASDLVRFGRVSERWRNDLVDRLEADERSRLALEALVDADVARDLARDAGTRELSMAEVVGVSPLRLRIASRRMERVESVAILHVNGDPTVERADVVVKIQKGSFKIGQMPVGTLSEGTATVEDPRTWAGKVSPDVSVGDVLVVADVRWLGGPFASGHEVAVSRGAVDDLNGPKVTCGANSYAENPEEHMWCCRSHEEREAGTADWIAERRAEGEMNPQVWPPLIDSDQFDAPALASVTEDVVATGIGAGHAGLTTDDID